MLQLWVFTLLYCPSSVKPNGLQWLVGVPPHTHPDTKMGQGLLPWDPEFAVWFILRTYSCIEAQSVLEYNLNLIFMYLLTKESACTWLTVFYNSFILKIDLKQYHSGCALKPPWHSSEESGREIWVQENLKLIAASLLKPTKLCTSKSSPNTMT